MESALIAESGYLKDAFADLKHNLLRDQESLRETISAEIEERLDKFRDQLEDDMDARLKTIEELDVSRSQLESYKKSTTAVVGTVSSSEPQARLQLQESLRAEFSTKVWRLLVFSSSCLFQRV